jgi:hypothetical protein
LSPEGQEFKNSKTSKRCEGREAKKSIFFEKPFEGRASPGNVAASAATVAKQCPKYYDRLK